MRTIVILLSVWFLVAVSPVHAQETAPKSMQLHPQTQKVYRVVHKILVESAEKMPEEHYNFRPAESVRTFGQIVGHLSDSQRWFCSIALGEKNTPLNIEKTKTSKADLIAALKDTYTYCSRAHDAMTEVTAIEPVKMMKSDLPRLGVLEINNMHAMQHYGNLITYMRIKNIVPPTSEPGFMESARQ